MGGSSQKSHTTQTTVVSYAPYVQSQHASFLATVATKRAAVIDDDPFDGYTDVEVENAFFGAGYTISNFPALYDMYGKFMAGLDVDVLFDQIFEETVDSTVVSDLTSTEAALMEDDIEINSLPRIQVGMRDINSVIASSYPIAKAILEDARTKSVAKYRADLRYRLIPIAQDRWQVHLQWNQQVVTIYSEIMKFYYAAKHDVNEDNYSFAAKSRLWPFTVLEFERAALGALQGATNNRVEAAGASTTSRVLSGALAGAAMGAMVGNTIKSSTGGTYAGVGAVAGAVLGAASAYLY
jgi:hypothetical protein